MGIFGKDKDIYFLGGTINCEWDEENDEWICSFKPSLLSPFTDTSKIPEKYLETHKAKHRKFRVRFMDIDDASVTISKGKIRIRWWGEKFRVCRFYGDGVMGCGLSVEHKEE